MELLEEKREDIQKIIWKRQRKAALLSLVGQADKSGKPTMTGYVGRQKLQDPLPDITPKKPRPVIKIGGDGDSLLDDTHTESLLGKTNMKKLRKYDKGETDSSIDPAERAFGALDDPNDPEEQRIEKLQQEINEKYAQRPRITLKSLQ